MRATTAPLTIKAVALPDGAGGIGFDDLRYDATLGEVLAPGGRSGNLDLIDPTTQAVTRVAGFRTQPRFNGGHDDGPTSQRLSVVDPSTTATCSFASSARQA